VADPTENKSLLKRIVDVRGNELGPALVSQLWIFLAMTAYYIIKPIRGQTLQDVIGVDNKPKALVATTLFVAVFALVYGRIAATAERKKLIIGTYLVFIGCVCGFATVMNAPSVVTGYIFFVWVSTFSVMIVSQFWALAADVWTKEEGVRLFSFIGYGTVAGGFSGTYITKILPKLDSWQFLLISAGILTLCLGCSLYILTFGAKKADAPKANKETTAEKPDEKKPAVNALSMVLKSPYLRLIAAMTLLLNLVNSNNEWILDKMFSLHGGGDSRTFYADFYLWQNVAAAVIQFGITGFVQRKFGARVALCFLPLVGMIGGSAFLLVPALAVIRGLKIAENATDYSIQSNTREFLYLPTTKLEKYAAKNVNETFVVRAGDLLAAGSIEIAKILLATYAGGGLKMLVVANLVFGAIWIVIVLRIGLLNRELMEERHVEAPREAK